MIDNHIYVTGGWDGQSHLTEILRWDPFTESWQVGVTIWCNDQQIHTWSKLIIVVDHACMNNDHSYDKLWASVMKAVPKLDESESGQMVLE